MYKLTLTAAIVASAAAINTDVKAKAASQDVADRNIDSLAPLTAAEVPTQAQIDRAINYFGDNADCVDLFNQLIRIRTTINTQIEEYKVLQTKYDRDCKILFNSNNCL
jgi:hypothetical protein